MENITLCLVLRQKLWGLSDAATACRFISLNLVWFFIELFISIWVLEFGGMDLYLSKRFGETNMFLFHMSVWIELFELIVWKIFERGCRNSSWYVHKLLSAYFLKLSKIAYENSLYENNLILFYSLL